MKRVGVFAGSFDPVHNGHLDLIHRSRPLFDELVVAVLFNETKQALFSVEERIEMLEELLPAGGGFRVESFSGLLMEFVDSVGAQGVVRGLRGVVDFDYELQMTLMNRRLNPRVETVFLMPSGELIHLSSRLIKEVCSLGGDVSGLVPARVLGRLEERLRSG